MTSSPHAGTFAPSVCPCSYWKTFAAAPQDHHGGVQQERLCMGQVRAEKAPGPDNEAGSHGHPQKHASLSGSVCPSRQTSRAILSPDFPFALKGRLYDCQPQSSDPDLGVYLFLLEANFYALCYPHKRGKIIITRTHSSFPTAGTLLFNSLGSALRYFSSAKQVSAHLPSPG